MGRQEFLERKTKASQTRQDCRHEKDKSPLVQRLTREQAIDDDESGSDGHEADRDVHPSEDSQGHDAAPCAKEPTGINVESRPMARYSPPWGIIAQRATDTS